MRDKFNLQPLKLECLTTATTTSLATARSGLLSIRFLEGALNAYDKASGEAVHTVHIRMNPVRTH